VRASESPNARLLPGWWKNDTSKFLTAARLLHKFNLELPGIDCRSAKF
jgi:hypothetical protein